VEWTEAPVVRLVDALGKYECFWNVRNKEYHDRNLRLKDMYHECMLLLHVALYSVTQKSTPPVVFLTFFPKRLGIFSPNFTHLLYVPIYARVQIFIQLPTTSALLGRGERRYINVLNNNKIMFK